MKLELLFHLDVLFNFLLTTIEVSFKFLIDIIFNMTILIKKSLSERF